MKKHTISKIVNVIGLIFVAAFAGMVFQLALTSPNLEKASKHLGTLLSLAIMTWVYFDIKPTDFRFSANQGYLRTKHILMLSLLIISVSFDSFYWGALYVILVTYQVFDNYRANKIWGVPAFNWVQESDTPISLEAALKIFSEKHTEIEIKEGPQKISIHGRLYMVLDVLIELYPERSTIRVQHQQTFIVFLLVLKIWPIPMGSAYGKRFQSAVNEAKELESSKTL